MRDDWQTRANATNEGFELVKSWIAECPFQTEVLSCAPADGRRVLESLDVRIDSPFDALALHTGGVLIDKGWLRVLGAGSPKLPRAIDRWNGMHACRRLEGGVLVADDAVGGFFAWFASTQTIHYLAPNDSLWDDLKVRYADWLHVMLRAHLRDFYRALRWQGCVEAVQKLNPTHAIRIVPHLIAPKEGACLRGQQSLVMEDVWKNALCRQRQNSIRPADEVVGECSQFSIQIGPTVALNREHA